MSCLWGGSNGRRGRVSYTFPLKSFPYERWLKREMVLNVRKLRTQMVGHSHFMYTFLSSFCVGVRGVCDLRLSSLNCLFQVVWMQGGVVFGKASNGLYIDKITFLNCLSVVALHRSMPQSKTGTRWRPPDSTCTNKRARWRRSFLFFKTPSRLAPIRLSRPPNLKRRLILPNYTSCFWKKANYAKLRKPIQKKYFVEENRTKRYS